MFWRRSSAEDSLSFLSSVRVALKVASRAACGVSERCRARHRGASIQRGVLIYTDRVTRPVPKAVLRSAHAPQAPLIGASRPSIERGCARALPRNGKKRTPHLRNAVPKRRTLV